MTAQTNAILKGYFNTNDKPTEAQFANLIDSIICPTSSVADNYFTWTGSATGIVTPSYVTLQVTGTVDTHIGINYKSLGTTISNGQFNGYMDTGSSISGEQNFYIANVLAVKITDTYFNPSTYSIIDGGILLSSGSSQGLTETSAVVSAIIVNPATATSATLRLNAMGPIGEIHLVNNGFVGATVSSGTNPNGNNKYCDSYFINLNGICHGSSVRPSISVQSSDGTHPQNANLVFYQSGSAGFDFESDNTNSIICRMKRVASAVNRVYIQGAADGSPANCIVGAEGNSADIDLSLLCQGVGVLRFGTYTGTGGIAQAGFITIKDAAGNTRRLLVG